ncbi:MAG: hypothetical protein M3Y65_14225 [Pseudomonadota bacterium]|nr:hypothetical protein [Pseudomonadota bacterium]
MLRVIEAAVQVRDLRQLFGGPKNSPDPIILALQDAKRIEYLKAPGNIMLDV